jgi:hypothetical protein
MPNVPSPAAPDGPNNTREDGYRIDPVPLNYGVHKRRSWIVGVSAVLSLIVGLGCSYVECVFLFWKSIWEADFLVNFHGSFFDLFRISLIPICVVGILLAVLALYRSRGKSALAYTGLTLNLLVLLVHLERGPMLRR